VRAFEAGELHFQCAVVENVAAETFGLFQLAVR
jgi:hypothetical protein